MRTRTQGVLVFLGGFVVGATSFAALVGWHWKANFEDWYVLGVADQANVAHEIYSGRGDALAARIRQDLPHYVLVVDREFPDSRWATPALWLANDVYTESSMPVPPEIEEILGALPPKPPGCCKLPAPGERTGR
jgi:hypothetical protein